MNEKTMRHLAIIGGGFSGTMALAHLIRLAPYNAPVSIVWFEHKHPLGTGVAYGTPGKVHLLNVRAELMGAYAQNPRHFYEWLQTSAGKQAAQHYFPEQYITEETYVPRALYGEYLKHITAETLALAKEKSILLEIKHAFVSDAMVTDGTPARLKLFFDKETLVVDAAILATGNPPPKPLPFAKDLSLSDPHYIHDIWHPPDTFSQTHIAALAEDSIIVIVGTGLTAIDTILSLHHMGFKGQIVAISRNGLLPTVHTAPKKTPQWDWVTHPGKAPHTTLGLLSGLRAATQYLTQQGYDWRNVIDSLRPVTQTLWQQLPIHEKKRFLKRLGTLWGVHRHRLAESIYQTISSLQENATLTITAAKILSVTPAQQGIKVTYKQWQKPLVSITATLLVNCTSPDYDVHHSSNDLLQKLCRNGMITPHMTGTGISVNNEGGALGTASDAVFAIGPLKMGELLESIAVPELREQALSTAQTVLRQFGCC